MIGKSSALAVAAMCAATAAGAVLGLSAVSEATRPDAEGAVELSGVTWAGGDSYYAVDNADRKLYRLTVDICRSSGAILTNFVGVGVPLADAADPEGCAIDPWSGKVWVSDEKGARIRKYDPETGDVLRSAPVPAILKQYRPNFSLEALTISGDGKTMWTSNEEALKCDGGRATKKAGSVVRLTKFVRESQQDGWTHAGQWAYLTEPVGSGLFVRNGDVMNRSGVSGLCVLPDGTLLVLERCLTGDSLWNTTFFTRIFQVDFTGATEVSGMDSLKGSDYVCVAKVQLFNEDVGWANYEGICLGPQLDDGSHVLILVADGGNCTKKIMTMRLSGL